MEARNGQEETSPIVPSSLPSIDFLTHRNRRDCYRFLLNLNETKPFRRSSKLEKRLLNS